MYSFSREQTGFFITLYEKFPALYNIEHADYKNKAKRLEIILLIREACEKQLGIVVSVEDIKKKINTLRTQFFAEIAKIKKSQANGSGEKFTSSWWCFDDLSFLQDSAPLRKIKSSLQEPPMERMWEPLDEETVDEIKMPKERLMSPSSDRPYSASPISEPARKKNKANSCQHYKLIEKSMCLLESTTKQQKAREEDNFGLTIASELRKFKDQRKANEIKKQIFTLIYDGLNEDILNSS